MGGLSEHRTAGSRAADLPSRGGTEHGRQVPRTQATLAGANTGMEMAEVGLVVLGIVAISFGGD